MKAKLRNNTYLIYSIIFLLLLPIIYMPFLIEGRTFVWNIDGINQHYPILIYYGELLRGLFMGKGFPMVDFSIGLGFDTITTLHYYAIGDPIALLSVFMVGKIAPLIYSLMILLRLYLIGISFLIFGRYWRLNKNGVILGAIMFVFCGYSYFSGVRHPYFLNPMIYLPLLLIGLEEVLRRKKPQLLIIISFLCTISNFYFLYIVTVMAVIYVMLRYIGTYYKEYKNKVVGLLLIGLRTGSYYILGMSMAAVIFLPIVYAFFQNGRMESKPEVLTGYFFYNKSYYIYALQGLFASGVTPHYWVDLTFVGLTGFSVAIIICNSKYRKLAIAFILTMLALFIPAFGYFMNAFTYITNRWDFLVAFVVAVVFAVTYEKLFRMGSREKTLIVIGILGYAVLAFVFPSEAIVKYAFLILLSSFLLIMVLQTGRVLGWQRLQNTVLYLLVIGNIAFNGYAYYSEEFNGYSAQFLTNSEISELTDTGAAKMLSELENEWYRVETYGDNVRNESLIHDYNDVSSYFSLMDGSVGEFYKELEMVSQRSAYRIDNQDSRTIPDALAGVKYFISTDRNAAPYAYELKETMKLGSETYYLFENLYALPIGYTYTSYMTEKDYHRLNSLQKQNALLYNVVLEKSTNHVKRTKQNMNVGIEELDYNIYVDGSIDLEGDGFRVINKGAMMKLSFDSKEKSETYIRFVNLTIDQREMLMRTFKVKGEGEISKKVNIRNKYHNTYFGKVNFLINMGYSKSIKNWVRITFPEKGSYGCDQIVVYSLSMKHIKQQLEQLRRESLQHVKESNNLIEGDIALSQNGILVLSIPYSTGWSATVDGEKAEIMKANVMYSAIELPEGEHRISLNYRTPYLMEGALISIAGLLLFIGITVYRNRKEVSNG